MNLFEVIEARRSVRKYLPESVPPSVIEKAIQAGLMAPNTSNLQPWEVYWVRTAEKRARLVEACFSQSCAATAAELVVWVARTDTWRRNRALILEAMQKQGRVPPQQLAYYQRIVPLFYAHGWFDLLGRLKALLFPIVGLFRPVPRGPFSTRALRATLSKTVALACQNFMLAITAQGYASCPMEGFDHRRVKQILGLGRESTVVMVISVGRADPSGVYGPRLRADSSFFIFNV